MKAIKWRSTRQAIEIILFWWFMFGVVEIFTTVIVFAIFLVTKVLIMNIPSYIHILAVLGIFVPDLIFKYFPTQED